MPKPTLPARPAFSAATSAGVGPPGISRSNSSASRGSAAVQRLDVLRQLHHAQWVERSNFLPGFDRFAASCGLAVDFDEICVHELVADQTVLAILVAFEVAAGA